MAIVYLIPIPETLRATSCVFRCTLISSDNSLIELDEGLVGCSLKRMEEVDDDTGFVTPSLRSCRGSIRSSFGSEIPGQVS